MTQPSYLINAAADLPPDPREPMSEVQAVRLRSLSEETGEPFDGALTKRQAARRIAALEEMAA
ncbi:DUF3072 domain-containing protein [Cognatishimia sp. F0-27]|uniref:DUF3072 domain-containing protein n=1 Tax=Cognatishimia sp. F0-27 TaxID=2816855 RepID=UPI001D0C99AF|nr:DUF3072 domain-containing protein [Cognatishimia sp. F0-27]MCC1493997.1 DUF3072 domain-containing protein [Cognatishimia sp. F0-27]